MSLGIIVGIVLALTGLGILLGGIIGVCLGSFAPAMFFALFPETGVDSAQLGLGLGVMNGLILGFILGIVAVLCLAFGKRNSQ